MNCMWQIFWLEGVIGCDGFAGLKECEGNNGFARCTSKISSWQWIWRLEEMKIGPWHRIFQVSRNILLATFLVGPKYFAEAKVLQHYTGNFLTCQRIVRAWEKGWTCCVETPEASWPQHPHTRFWPKFRRRMHVANKTMRWAMHRVLRQIQDQALDDEIAWQHRQNIQCTMQQSTWQQHDYKVA